MRIVSHGIDIVEVQRIGAVLSNHPERFLERCFTALEVAQADDAGPPARVGGGAPGVVEGEAQFSVRRLEYLAGRFAAKEGVLKALGTGLSGGVKWTDIEVARSPSGAPDLRLSGSARARAEELGIAGWLVSISHAAGVAIASVIATGG
ncbi:MAG: holo-ACP synthase [Phycisphaerales bacterium]